MHHGHVMKTQKQTAKYTAKGEKYEIESSRKKLEPGRTCISLHQIRLDLSIISNLQLKMCTHD
jgi:hypothetical protein